MNSNTKNMVDGDKTRRKRLKVVSACGECRRKKTKCNGEKPCAGCLKAHVECKYVNSQKSASTTSTPSTITAATITPAISNNSNNTITASTQKMIHTPSIETKDEYANKPIINNASPLSSTTSSSSTSTSTSHAIKTNNTASSIESIEERLGTIENILRALLSSGKNKHLLQGFQAQQQQQQRSESNTYIDPKVHYYNNHPHQLHHHHSDISSNTSPSSSCGDMYSSPHLVHAPHIQNRSIPREKRQRHEDEEEGMTENKRLNIRDDFGHGYHHQHHPYSKLQLAPIKIINHTPGTPPTSSIRNLLNDQTEEETQAQQRKPRWYPTSSSSSSSTSTTNSAFYRMSSPRNEIINSNSATTAAGTLS